MRLKYYFIFFINFMVISCGQKTEESSHKTPYFLPPSPQYSDSALRANIKLSRPFDISLLNDDFQRELFLRNVNHYTFEIELSRKALGKERFTCFFKSKDLGTQEITLTSFLKGESKKNVNFDISIFPDQETNLTCYIEEDEKRVKGARQFLFFKDRILREKDSLQLLKEKSHFGVLYFDEKQKFDIGSKDISLFAQATYFNQTIIHSFFLTNQNAPLYKKGEDGGKFSLKTDYAFGDVFFHLNGQNSQTFPFETLIPAKEGLQGEDGCIFEPKRPSPGHLIKSRRRKKERKQRKQKRKQKRNSKKHHCLCLSGSGGRGEDGRDGRPGIQGGDSGSFSIIVTKNDDLLLNYLNIPGKGGRGEPGQEGGEGGLQGRGVDSNQSYKGLTKLMGWFYENVKKINENEKDPFCRLYKSKKGDKGRDGKKGKDGDPGEALISTFERLYRP